MQEVARSILVSSTTEKALIPSDFLELPWFSFSSLSH